MEKRLLRSEVDVQSKWDLTSLFETREDYISALEQVDTEVEKVLVYQGKLVSDATTLYEGLKAIEEFTIRAYSVGTYAMLAESVDATNTEIQKDSMRFGQTQTRVFSKLTFIDSEILTLSEEEFAQFFIDEPRLEEYRTHLEVIYSRKAHMLSPETEQALAALGSVTNAPYKTYSVSKATDMVFDNIKDSEGNELPNSFALFEGKYEYSQDDTLRRNAYDSFNKTLKQYVNTYSAVYGTEVNKQIAMRKLRGYDNVIDMLLEDQKVTKEMYNRQIDVIYKELAPHMQKYAELIKQELGLDKVRFCDLKAPIDTTYNPSATFEEAKDTVLEALSIMGEEYLEGMKRAFDENWVDYADNVGKRTGAFCASPYAAHPYILMTFQDKMRDAFTLAHELGHAGHFYLANREQNLFNTRPSRYVIEAPSTMNEMLLGRHMLSKSNDPKTKKWVILQFLGTYYHNFVTHLLEAAFQREVYSLAEQGVPLTSKTLCDIKLDVLKGFWQDSVEIDDEAGLTWMRQPHYYMGLYPYTYSAGLTASTAVSQQIFEEGKPAVERWIKMLKSGGKHKPLEMLEIAGMDFTTDEPVQIAVAYVGSLIDDLTELCK